MLFLKTQYLIQINYKSGSKERFWCDEFSVDSGCWSWTSSDGNSNNPLKLNVDNIESVWQKEYRIKALGITTFKSTRK